MSPGTVRTNEMKGRNLSDGRFHANAILSRGTRLVYINSLKMERDSFKEYSVLAMVSKEEQPLMKASYNFFFTLIASLLESTK